MSSRFREHVRCNVVGYIALFCFAMAGTASAVDGPLQGQNKVGSTDIINGEVYTEDIELGAVNRAKISGDAVSADKILDGTVGTAEIGQGGVASSEVENDSLTGDDVLNGSLTTADLAKHTIVRDDLAFNVPTVFTANVSGLGSAGLIAGNGATSVTKRSEGAYRVHFAGVDVRACIPQVSLASMFAPFPKNGEISAYIREYVPNPENYVDVYTWDSTALGGAPPAASDRNFYLTLTC